MISLQTEYHQALFKCGHRYKKMQASSDCGDLWFFTLEFIQACEEGRPIPKLCRWLGYIQGLLIERGFTTVNAERDWTRLLFTPLDKAEIHTPMLDQCKLSFSTSIDPLGR